MHRTDIANVNDGAIFCDNLETTAGAVAAGCVSQSPRITDDEEENTVVDDTNNVMGSCDHVAPVDSHDADVGIVNGCTAAVDELVSNQNPAGQTTTLDGGALGR